MEGTGEGVTQNELKEFSCLQEKYFRPVRRNYLLCHTQFFPTPTYLRFMHPTHNGRVRYDEGVVKSDFRAGQNCFFFSSLHREQISQSVWSLGSNIQKLSQLMRDSFFGFYKNLGIFSP